MDLERGIRRRPRVSGCLFRFQAERRVGHGPVFSCALVGLSLALGEVSRTGSPFCILFRAWHVHPNTRWAMAG